MKHQYFIGLIPPHELATEIRTIQHEFAESFNSSRALRPPVHLTILPPFWQEEDAAKELSTKLQTFFSLQKGFTISLNGFGSFEERVIFIQPEANESLLQMHEAFIAYLRNELGFAEKDTPERFNPHITVAYRDLTPAMFAKAWPEFESRSFKASFEVSAACLLMHNTKVWEVINEYKLNAL